MGARGSSRRAGGGDEQAATLDHSDLLIAPRGEGSVVLHLPSGTYLQLDGPATTVLHLVGERGQDGAVAELVRRHGVDEEVARADVAGVVDTIVGAESSPERPVRRPGIVGVAGVARQWLRMDRWAKVAVVQVSLLVVAVEVALRFRPVDDIARRVGAPLALHPEAGGADLRELDRTGLSRQEALRLRALDWVLARWLVDATCLRQALVGGWILRGRHPRLHIGLTDRADVVAHAWLVVEGGTVGALGQIRDFARLPGSGDDPGPT
jgi:hypothetical protein